MEIKGIKLENNLMLAPMAGVTDLPYRLLCKEQGCGYMVTEMVSAKAILFRNKNTELLLQTKAEEGMVGLQLFGSEPEVMAEAVKMLEPREFVAFDINMGCPVPKIVNNGEGSALMKDPKLAESIVKAMSQATKKPITVKFRKGFTEETVNAVDFAKRMENAGASAITIHGRTRDQYYSGSADWNIIQEVVNAVEIPVFGNGDVTSAEDAMAMMRETGCQGIGVGRAAKGNPWIFREIIAGISGETIPSRPNLKEIRDMIKRHASLMVEYKPEFMAIREMRKHVSWYTTGLHNCSALRKEINETETLQALFELLDKRMIDK